MNRDVLGSGLGMGEDLIDGIYLKGEVSLDGLVESFGLLLAGKDFILFVRKALVRTSAGAEVVGGSEAHK